MLFNSLEFLLFLPLVMFMRIFLKGIFQHQILLVVSSFIFYSWGNPWHLSLLLISGIIDYYIGKKLYEKKKISLLLISICLNLAILSLFKYGFTFMKWLSPEFLVLGVPIGVSFYTFQSMSYSIDIYRGKLKPADNPLHFFSYLAFFPQLVAGPICRGEELLGQMNQLDKKRINIDEALRFLSIGFFQKVFLADYLGKCVDNAYNTTSFIQSGITWWLVHMCFGYQIYMDFCGYSNIARGLAELFGIQLPPNFDFPYFKDSLTNFWRSWHITLSNWFRDYVYIPLGGSKKGEVIAYLYILLVFVLSGIWHGNTFNFFVWGAFCGFSIIMEKSLLKALGKKEFLLFGHIIVIFSITLSWVFFRSPDLTFGVKVLGKMLSLEGMSKFHLNRADQQMIFFLFIAFSFDFINFKLVKFKGYVREYIFLNMIIPLSLFFRVGEKVFIYFRF